MGKAAQRKKAPKAPPAGDIHARIVKEAKSLITNEPINERDAEKTPALNAMISSALKALTDQIPSTFEHEGRTYYVRFSIAMAHVMVFETATAAWPMLFGLSSSDEEFGHLPFH